ncbi:MAG: CAP domain-containing protein [Planctomycetes bacterium]|nr:CAP domain-containing protein [Planctomycetota bacterium]
MNRQLLYAGFLILCVLFTSRAGETPKSTLSAEEQKILDLTNAERKKNDLSPLQASPLLCKLARAHSANMARQEKMTHDLDGKTPYQRMKDAGYAYARAGENVAQGDAGITVEQIFKGWMDSKSHRENILRKEVTEIGIGLGAAKNGGTYYTQVFARPLAK